MLNAAIAFFVLAILSYLVGATGLAGMSAEIGHTLLMVFIVLAIISFLANILRGRGPRV